jgi:hypothetical protein
MMILYGGAVGGGKSVCLVNDALIQALAYAGNRVGIFRWEYSTFMKTTFKTMLGWVFGPAGLVVGHNQPKHEVRLVNGSEIVYGGLKPSSSASGDPLSLVKSLELGAAYVDEVTDVPSKVFEFLPGRTGRVVCRTPGGGAGYPPQRVMCSCNPALGWVKQKWVDQQLPNHVFIPARVADNPHLPESYQENLRREWADNEEALRRYLEGDWDAVVDHEAIFPAPWLMRAQRSKYVPREGDAVEFGVDVGAYGSDATVVIMRTGHRAEVLLEKRRQSTMETADQVAMLADLHHPSSIKVDAIGVGQGVCDRLSQLGFPVFPFVGGAKPTDPRYKNLRASAYWELRTLLERGLVDLPRHSGLINEMGEIHFSQTPSDKTIQVESKETIKKRLGRSPDFADACVYAFFGAGNPYVISSLVEYG